MDREDRFEFRDGARPWPRGKTIVILWENHSDSVGFPPISAEVASMDLIPRMLTGALQAALTDTPVVFVRGARQVGKSTLVGQLLPDVRAITLDDRDLERAARNDPVGFLNQTMQGTTVIDEVQRVPDLLQAIKLVVDRGRRPGAFVLTGSANVLALPRVSESLAGRMESLTLRPLAQIEIERATSAGSFLTRVFAERLPSWRRGSNRDDLFDRMLVGGYPTSITRTAARRDAWFRSYLEDVVQRDVTEISRIADLDRIPKLLALVALRCAQPLNKTRISSEFGLGWNTIDTYLEILKAMFLVDEIPAWSRSSNARITRHSKMFVSDSGLASALLGIKRERLFEPTAPLGVLVETFVGNELARLRATDVDLDLMHYRTQRGEEVDFVLERRGRGGVVGVEVKAAASVGQADFRGIDALRRDAGAEFVRGIVFYTGETTVPFGHERYAVPINALWDHPD